MDKYAKNYFDNWNQEDSYHCRIFTHGRRGWNEDRLGELEYAMNYYGIMRVFPRRCDKDARYKPVFAVMDAIANVGDLVNTAEKCAEKLAGKYDDRGKLSAASKLLWLKFKRPFIIYDSRARESLVRLFSAKRSAIEENYGEYCKAWKEAYKQKQSAIAGACERLAKKNPSNKFILSPWFKERVFDQYLWEEGVKLMKK